MATNNEKEKEILEFWEKSKIYEKSKKKNSKGKKFYLMDGPPYATGYIHLGTALNKILKDIAMRAMRLQGRDVFDRPGYDTHGVPIEFQIEKEIGSKSKKDIEKYGVDKFVEKCKEYATKYIDVMNKQFKNLGVWMNWDNPYLTLSEEYIEAIWYAFKEADKKSLLYLGKYPVHICTRCETAVAYNEIEYGKRRDRAVFVKFPVKGEKNKFLIIWTTTPWTLPGNTGVMVNPEAEYSEVETSEGERWIIAKELVGKLVEKSEKGFTLKSEFKGKKLEGLKYGSPLEKYISVKINNGRRVVLSPRYVTTEEGTGLVHCAPGHGKEDFEVGRENGLDIVSPVNTNGEMSEEAGKYFGKKAFEANKEIIEDLKKDGYLVYEEEYEHDYPLCWRDKSPLLMISQPQWFLKISSFHSELLKENEKTNWVPDWMKSRMKAWLDGISDWPVSRQRYWGTPLPIWVCEETGDKIVVGSLDELKKLSGKKKIGIHKPEIDEVEIIVKGKRYKRVSEVLDVWFDSGVSSWAALGYPKNKAAFKKFWPADLNIEGKDQIRGWWNSQIILSEIAFDNKPFDNIAVHGMVLDVSKKKMSKSSGNFLSPEIVIEKHGRDYLRYYFAKLSKGEDFAYNEREFNEIGKVFMILSNTNNFVNQLDKSKRKLRLEDKWIISRYSSLVKEVTDLYKRYRFPEAVQKLEDFLVQDLSRRYIQIIRERSGETYDVFNKIRKGLLVLFSPIIPFMTEQLWRDMYEKKMVEEESIYLTEWPEYKKNDIDEKLEKEFSLSLKMIEVGLSERDKVKVGLRWPLTKAEIYSLENVSKELKEIVARQLNVKKVKVNKAKEFRVLLDTAMTRELEAEGYSRELARKVQAERKNSGLTKSDVIKLKISCDKNLEEMLFSNIDFLKDRINASNIEFLEDKSLKKPIVFTIKEKKISIEFS